MRRWLGYVGAFLCACCMTGCGSSLVRKLRIEEPVTIRQYGSVGMDADFVLRNASRRTLRVDEAELEFFSASGSLGRAVLRGEIEMPARSRSEVRSRWKLDIPDVASGVVLQRRLEEGAFDLLEVAVEMTVRAGGIRRRISCGRMTVSDFLNIFEGLSGDPAGDME